MTRKRLTIEEAEAILNDSSEESSNARRNISARILKQKIEKPCAAPTLELLLDNPVPKDLYTVGKFFWNANYTIKVHGLEDYCKSWDAKDWKFHTKRFVLRIHFYLQEAQIDPLVSGDKVSTFPDKKKNSAWDAEKQEASFALKILYFPIAGDMTTMRTTCQLWYHGALGAPVAIGKEQPLVNLRVSSNDKDKSVEVRGPNGKVEVIEIDDHFNVVSWTLPDADVSVIDPDWKLPVVFRCSNEVAEFMEAKNALLGDPLLLVNPPAPYKLELHVDCYEKERTKAEDLRSPLSIVARSGKFPDSWVISLDQFIVFPPCPLDDVATLRENLVRFAKFSKLIMHPCAAQGLSVTLLTPEKQRFPSLHYQFRSGQKEDKKVLIQITNDYPSPLHVYILNIDMAMVVSLIAYGCCEPGKSKQFGARFSESEEYQKFHQKLYGTMCKQREYNIVIGSTEPQSFADILQEFMRGGEKETPKDFQNAEFKRIFTIEYLYDSNNVLYKDIRMPNYLDYTVKDAAPVASLLSKMTLNSDAAAPSSSSSSPPSSTSPSSSPPSSTSTSEPPHAKITAAASSSSPSSSSVNIAVWVPKTPKDVRINVLLEEFTFEKLNNNIKEKLKKIKGLPSVEEFCIYSKIDASLMLEDHDVRLLVDSDLKEVYLEF